MLTRKFKKAVTRLRYLPAGFGLIKYFSNKARHFAFEATHSTHVASPSSLMIELTNLCNLRCITCAREYRYGEVMHKGLIDFALFTKIIDEAYPYVDSIGLTGLGETFLYKDIVRAAEYIKQKNRGIIIFVSTNAHLPDIEQMIGPLIGKIDTVQISIDGIGDVYNKIRRKADYDFFLDKVMKIAAMANGTTTDLMFNAVIFKDNYGQMNDIIELAAKLKIRFVYFNTFNLVATDRQIEEYEFYKSSEFKAELSRARQTAKMTGIELSTFDFLSPNGFRKCNFPWNHFYITWDGYVVPCCAKPFPLEMNFGDVKDTSLIDCLNSDSFRQFRTKWQANDTPDFCRKCHMIDLERIEI